VNTLEIERKSLGIARIFNVIMGIMGVTFAILSQSNAIMVDGLYSSVNFISSLIAARISLKLTLDADEKMPFGYDYYETLYITFRSLVLLGIMSISFFISVSKIVTYLTGGSVTELKMGVIMIYTGFNIILCFGLAAIHKKNHIKTNKRSEILKAEKTAATIDGVISLGVGVALIGITLAKGTILDFIIPIADSIVVIILVLFIVKEPLKLFLTSIGELLGRSIGEKRKVKVLAYLKLIINFEKYELIDLIIIKSGRNNRAVILLKPLNFIDVEEMDELRGKIHKKLIKMDSIRSEILFTGKKWY
jgi:predicted Co/Zn/Cd cation transporter (cation efflux family)